MPVESTASRVRNRLRNLRGDLHKHISPLSVRRAQEYPGVLVMQPGYYFRDLSAEEKKALLRLKRELDELMELLRVLLLGATKDVTYEFKQTAARLGTWVGDRPNYHVKPDAAATLKALDDAFDAMEAIVAILGVDSNTPPLIVPDTNALVHYPDPPQYQPIAGQATFTIVLLPTVLAELDELKNNHRNPDFRDKVKSAIRRIKGWRTQGSLRDGVTVQTTITVRTVHEEPNMAETLHWLNANVRDDRIIAAILELQRKHSDAPVVLVTEDVNLHNKAEAAAIVASDADACAKPANCG